MDTLVKFTNFLLDKGFTLIEENKQLKITIYELNGLFVRIEQDVNLERFISSSRTNNHSWKGWYDMGIIRFFIIGSPFENDSIVWFDQLSEVFMTQYAEIERAFSPANFTRTEPLLMALQKERAKVLFGYEG